MPVHFDTSGYPEYSMSRVHSGAARVVARDRSVQDSIAQFRGDVRPRVSQLAALHPHVADLAISFPALLLALAVPRSGFDVEPAIACVIAGAPLHELSQLADVPLWLRRLGPKMLVAPLPQLPGGAAFSRRIVNALPCSPKRAPYWFDCVARAAQCGDDAFAVWSARESLSRKKTVAISRLRHIGLFAWFSLRPGTLAHSLIEKPWSPAMAFKTALEAANAWRLAVELHVELAGKPSLDPWLKPATVDGYAFVPLSSAGEITAEARAMKNCLREYGCRLAHAGVRLWSVRKDGERVATLSIARWRRQPLLDISQLAGPQNGSVAAEIWFATRKWINGHDVPALLGQQQLAWGTATLDRATWMALWKPYWLAKRRIPDWLPVRPSREALDAL